MLVDSYYSLFIVFLCLYLCPLSASVCISFDLLIGNLFIPCIFLNVVNFFRLKCFILSDSIGLDLLIDNALSWNVLFSPYIVLESFAVYNNWGWHLWSLRFCSTSIQVFLAYKASIEKLGVILISLSLYFTWSLSLAGFTIPCLFWLLMVLIILYQRDFLFWPSILIVLYVSYTLISISYFRLGKFSSIILLQFFFCAFDLCTSFSLPIRFSLLIISELSWVFCAWNFLVFKFSLIEVSISAILSSVSEIFSSINIVWWWDLPLRQTFNFQISLILGSLYWFSYTSSFEQFY